VLISLRTGLRKDRPQGHKADRNDGDRSDDDAHGFPASLRQDPKQTKLARVSLLSEGLRA
jgi:hypothetical protein